MLLLALVTAALLRFWNLDQAPPGLYRDEAWNGLDALRVLDGERALFFTANNGREPLYIYLTSLAVAFLGPTTLAVRFSAALVGSLTTLPVYGLGRTWFGPVAGMLAAWLWAITLWPVHLSRLGLRPILFVPFITLAFWSGTLAYRRERQWLWLLAGLFYGLTFYTYLTARFTPLLLLALALYLAARGQARRLWPGAAWFAGAALLIALPLLLTFAADPALLLGRAGQVSILHPDVNQGEPLLTLVRQIGAALGMAIWRGDTILRHNPAGRPVFDLLLALPFVVGVLWCAINWRRPAAAATLLWTGIMLGPTILAADAPHFLRAVGVLPALLFFPALGLRQTGRALPAGPAARAALATAVLGASLFLTVRDYRAYSRDPAVAFAFEKAATDLAGAVNAEPREADVRLDERFWSSWPSVSFLVDRQPPPARFTAGSEAAVMALPGALYAWPYESLDFVPDLLPAAAVVTAADGTLARGDQEAEAYPLFVRYGLEESTAVPTPYAASFADQLFLRQAAYTPVGESDLAVDLYWEGRQPVQEGLSTFVHVTGEAGLIGQDDGPLADGRWPAAWWQPGLVLHERRIVPLQEPFVTAQHRVTTGLYDPAGGQRLPVTDGTGKQVRDDAWLIGPR